MITIEKISKPTINRGIYTISDVSKILHIPDAKVRRWVDEYWDTKFSGFSENDHYSWNSGNGKVLDFYTMIEIYIFSELRESGVKIKDIVQAHEELANHYKTPFPFSNKDVVKGLKTDGKKVYFKFKDGIISLDGTKQFNLEVVKDFFKKVDFNSEMLVSKFYPLGKKKNVVVDPQIKFGQPVLKSTGISVDTIYDLFLSGEKLELIAFLYNLEVKDVRDAVKYCKSAA